MSEDSRGDGLSSPPPRAFAPPDLARWLVHVLRDDEPAEQFDQTGRLSVPMQLQQLSFADPDFGVRLKDALPIAIVEWQPPHGIDLLAELSRCVAYVRASNAIPMLYTMLSSGRVDGYLSGADGNPRTQDRLNVIVGAIAGFAPHAGAKAAVENLFVDHRFRARFAAQLVTALVRADSENYPRYVEQLLRLEHDKRITGDMLGITREIVRIANPATIVRELSRFPPPWHFRFCDLLGGYEQSPARWASHSGFILQTRPATRYAAVEYDPQDSRQSNDVCEVIDARIDREGGITIKPVEPAVA